VNTAFLATQAFCAGKCDPCMLCAQRLGTRAPAPSCWGLGKAESWHVLHVRGTGLLQEQGGRVRARGAVNDKEKRDSVSFLQQPPQPRQSKAVPGPMPMQSSWSLLPSR